MAKTIVIDLPESADQRAVLAELREVFGSHLPGGSREFWATDEDADTVLSVFPSR